MILRELPNWVPWFFAMVAIICAITDTLKNKVYNVITFSSFFLGLVLVLIYSPTRITDSISGILIAMCFFVPMFIFKIMGAGDAKLVMALSTVLGSAQTLDLIYGSFLVGSLGAIVLLIRKKRVRIFFREVFNFFKTLFIKDLKIIWPKLDRETKAPFAVAICMGYFYVWSKLWK